MSVETHFSDIQSVITIELNKAKWQILVAVAWFTDDLLYNKLEDALKQGITVTLILNDDDINQFSGLNFEQLVNKGAEIYLYDSKEDIMHQKFCIIDNNIVLSGSYNWTKRAANRNTENLIVFKNEKDTITNFTKQFSELLTKSKKFTKRKKFNTSDSLIIDDFIPITPKIVEKEQSVSSEKFVSQDYTNPDLIPFRLNEKWGFCDKNRNIKIPLIFDDARPYSEGIAAIRVNDLWGFIDTEGTKICDCKFNNVKDFRNGYASVQRGWRIRAGTYIKDGQKHRKFGFSNYPNDLKNYWGCINRSGEIIIKLENYDLGEYSDGLFNYYNHVRGWGYLDNKNEIVIEPKYSAAEPFSEGIGCVKKRYSKYDKNTPKNTCFFINSTDEILFERGFYRLDSFYKGYAPFEIYTEVGNFNCCGLMDKNGNFIIKPQYTNIGKKFNQGCIAVEKKILTGRFEGEYELKWGFVGINNNIVIPFKYDQAGYFNNGRSPVRNDEKSKYGYINMEGKLVIDYIFESGYPFKNDLAQVKIGGQKGYIDVKGNQYWEN